MTVWIHSPFDNLPAEGFRRQRYWMMAEAFARQGHRVIYLTGDFNHGTKRPRVLQADPSSRSTGIELYLIPTLPYPTNVCLLRVRSHLLSARRLARLVTTLPRPDVVISATPTLSSATVLQASARRLGARFVLDVQDAWPETFERLFPRPLRIFAHVLFAPLRWKARWLYRSADLVTGVSIRYADLVKRPDFYLAYHGIEPTSAPRSRSVEGGTRLVYIGNLGVGYDLATVIEAVRRDETLTLDIAGSGPQEEALRRLQVPRVKFHGYLPDAALQRLLAAGDIGVIPLRAESWVGLPYKLGDYLRAGLQVVSSLDGECGELLRRTQSGTVYTPESVEGLLTAIARVRDHGRTILPESLREDCIYPAYVARVTSLARTCR